MITSRKVSPLAFCLTLVACCALQLGISLQWMTSSMQDQDDLWILTTTTLARPDTFPLPSARSQGVVLDVLSVQTDSSSSSSSSSSFSANLLQAQHDTWGSHPAVRTFQTATYKDDAERHCTSNLTLFHVRNVADRCQSGHRHVHFPHLYKLGKLFPSFAELHESHANPMEWMCAQKRPVHGLYRMLQQHYRYQPFEDASSPRTFWFSWLFSFLSIRQPTATNYDPSSLPDYLILVKDDTYLNLDQIEPHLRRGVHPLLSTATAPLQAGCLTTRRRTITSTTRTYLRQTNTTTMSSGEQPVTTITTTTTATISMTHPHSGFGIFWPRIALERLMQPLHCDRFTFTSSSSPKASSLLRHDTTVKQQQQPQDDDNNINDKDMEEFVQEACWRVSQNKIGEGTVFQTGMSLMDLLQALAAESHYNGVNQWGDRPGFWYVSLCVCFCVCRTAFLLPMSDRSVSSLRCVSFHSFESDLLWAYFVRYYRISPLLHRQGPNATHAKPRDTENLDNEAEDNATTTTTPSGYSHHGWLQYPDPKHDSSSSSSSSSSCAHSGTNYACSMTDPICHGLDAPHMRYLYENWNAVVRSATTTSTPP